MVSLTPCKIAVEKKMLRLLVMLITCLLLPQAALAHEPGSDGLNDRLYPKLGNSGYDTQHYNIELQFWPQEYRIGGITSIYAVATQALSSFNLDLFGLTVESVAVNGEAAGFERIDHELIVTPVSELESGDAFTVEVTYAGRPVPLKDPAIWWQQLGWQFFPQDFYLTVSEPSGAMNWYPCNNHPRDKATYSIQVTVPADLTAISNGVLTEQLANTDDTTTFVWEMDAPMASRDVLVAVGDFVLVRDDTGPVPIRHYVPRDMAEYVPEVLFETQAMMAWLIDKFGPYPFAEFGVAVIPGFRGSTNHQTMPVIGPGYMTAEYLIHSLAHAWYGNSVSITSWEDMWLKEGIVTYFDMIWPYDAWQQSSKNEIIAYFGHTLAGPARPDVDNLYGAAPYYGGALAMDALRTEAGDDIFYAILRQFHERYQGGSASTADFIAVAEDVSGRDLAAFFDAWLYGDELPISP